MKLYLIATVCLFIWVLADIVVPVDGGSQRPSVIKIGAVYTFDSVIGRAAKPAIEAAVSDVNKDPGVLNGTELRLIAEDARCSVFLGSIGAFRVIEDEVVAIIGPQSSGIARMMSEIANGFGVPLISYAATDPTLSALQFPYFVRTTQSDSVQMAAIADLVGFYGWKEVIAIFVDDEYGRNGIASLEAELEKRKAKFLHKMRLRVDFDERDIVDVLHSSKSLGPRVYVVHVSPDPRLRIFTVARKLEMMTEDFVWLVTDWLSTTLDSFLSLERTELDALQGVVGLRQHIPDSSQKRKFAARWKGMMLKGSARSNLNLYGLQAYDTVWTVSYALDKFIREFNNITFSPIDMFSVKGASIIEMSKLEVFSGGSILLEKIMQTNFTGLTGRVQFDQNRNVQSAGYEVINICNSSVLTVGYWSNNSGISVVPPEARKEKQNDLSRGDQRLLNVTWPGGKTKPPRGWIVADEEKPLRIGVPRRASFVGFVTQVNNSHAIEGYCIDVFLEARKLVPYYVPYTFIPFGSGLTNPSYDELVKMVSDGVFDAAVGDVAIVTTRTKLVDFSQPFTSTGLVIVAPVKSSRKNAWVFLKPFSAQLWLVTFFLFVMIAVVIWILEHRVNDHFRGPPSRQLSTMFMFSFSTPFKKYREKIVSPLGRLVMVVWLFLLMVLVASYTASLTSILTAQQLSSPISGIDSLIASNWPIGYQIGSFAHWYLAESLYVSRSRLVSLTSPEDFERALRLGPNNGGVAAIIDELPYIELFLANRTEFGIIGQPFTRGGWGFAFQRDSPLAVDISTAILKLAENGVLERIHEKWFCQSGCPEERGKHAKPNRLNLVSFWGLYIISGGVTLLALLLFLLRMVRQFARYKRQQAQSPSSSSSIASSNRCYHVIGSFFDFIDEKEEAIKKMFS